MTGPTNHAACIVASDERVYALRRRHGKALRALESGQSKELRIPGVGDTLPEQIVDRRETYAAVVVLVRELADSGVRLAIFPVDAGLLLVRMNGAKR